MDRPVRGSDGNATCEPTAVTEIAHLLLVLLRSSQRGGPPSGTQIRLASCEDRRRGTRHVPLKLPWGVSTEQAPPSLKPSHAV